MTDRPPAQAFRITSPVAGALVATYVMTVVMAATTLPTPLYAIYASRLHLKPFLITVIFAAYAVAVLAALLLFGRLSDLVGRKPVLLTAMAFSAASAVVFVSSVSLPALFAGRLLSGISAGLVTGAATAYISELHHDKSRGSLLATLANMGGLGLGPLISGVLAEHFARPTELPFIAAALLLVPALVLLAVPDTVKGQPGGLRAGIQPQRLGVPREIRVSFAAAAIAGFVAFALLGFITALVGNFLGTGLGNHSHQTAGVVAFLVFTAGTVGQLLATGVSNRTASLIGLGIMPVGLTLMTVALPATSLPLFLVGSMLGGVGAGFAFRAAILNTNAIAPAQRRAEVLSTFFVIAYVGIALPVLLAGILITTTTLLTATVTLACMVTALAAVAAAILVRLPSEASTP